MATNNNKAFKKWLGSTPTEGMYHNSVKHLSYLQFYSIELLVTKSACSTSSPNSANLGKLPNNFYTSIFSYEKWESIIYYMINAGKESKCVMWLFIINSAATGFVTF